MKKVIRIGTLEDQDKVAEDVWADSTPLERLAAVEGLRQAAWALYGKPEHGLERVLKVASFPPS